MKANKPQADVGLDPPMGPAVVTPLHVQDRPATNGDMKAIMGTAAWRKLTPLEAIYAKSQLAGGSPKYAAADRFAAGKRYAAMYDATESSGRDSTQALNVSRSTAMGTNSDAQNRAWSLRLAVESHMGERDRQIVRMVCGDGFWPSEAVRSVCGDYKDTISARFREALDSLIEAFETARRKPNKFGE